MAPAQAEYRFNNEEADRVVAFFERLLRHTKGIYAGSPFILTPWQKKDIIQPLFGSQRFDDQWGLWVRRYSIAWIELARGNGKSELGAGIALLGLCADGEEGAEIYGAAEDRDQAAIVYRVAKRMVELSPTLRKRLRIIDSQKRIVHEPSGSFYQVLPRDEMGEGSQGFNPHVVVFDEYHVQRTAALKDALRRGMGKGRAQPLLVMITTAGNDPTSPAWQEHDYSAKVLEGKTDDPSRFVYILNTLPDVDPWKEKNWRYANPALGDFLSVETLRQEAREARAKPSEENSFRQFRLNQWVKQHFRWMPLERWDTSASMVAEDKLAGRSCYAGLRLASTTDIVGLALDFPGDDGFHDAIYRFFIPEARMRDLETRTGGQATVWAREGFLTVTDGDVTDYVKILDQIDNDAQRFDIQEIAYDRWGATQLSQMLQDAGLTVVQFGQGITAHSAPTKEWERLIYIKKYRHGGNPVMRWMMDNVVVKTDSSSNIRIDLQRSKDTVVGPVAAVMALDRAVRNQSEGDLGAILVGDTDA